MEAIGSPVNEPRIVVTRPEEISVIEVMNVLLRKRRIVISCALVVGLLAGIITLLRPVKYTASASFLPQNRENNANGAAALARQWGFNLGGDRSGYSPHFYAELLTTRDILRPTVETPFAGGRQAGQAQTLIEWYKIERRDPEAWQKAADKLRKDLTVGVGKETDVVRMTVTNRNPLVAEEVAARMLELLNEFNLGVRRNKAIEEVRFTAARLEEIGDSLEHSENALKSFLERNRNFSNSPELQFERDRLQRKVAMRQELFTMLSQSMEQERIESMRDMPVLTVISRPEDSARRKPRGSVKNGILGLLLGTLLGVTVALLAEHYRRAAGANPDVKTEFRELARETLKDLRRPSRIFNVKQKT